MGFHLHTHQETKAGTSMQYLHVLASPQIARVSGTTQRRQIAVLEGLCELLSTTASTPSRSSPRANTGSAVSPTVAVCLLLVIRQVSQHERSHTKPPPPPTLPPGQDPCPRAEPVLSPRRLAVVGAPLQGHVFARYQVFGIASMCCASSHAPANTQVALQCAALLPSCKCWYQGQQGGSGT